MLFTIFNNASLRGYDPSNFKYETPEEESNSILERAEWAVKNGYSL